MKLSVSGKPEQSAGNIDITLTEESPTHVAYSGTTETSSGVERLNAAVHKKDDLQLLARGGNGHDGVRGANGRDGRDGRKGADATACMDAGPGENGTDGEPGQPGTDGGPAGDGGHIKITVGDADLALLGIIRETDVSAGTPGKAGSHGKGGKGGRGGQGGDQYMEYGSDHHHHHDSHHHYHPHHDMPHFIYRPQGSNGESGKDGFTPTTPLHPGKPGVNGTVNYYITSQGRVQSTHSEPYHLTMASLKLQSEQQSGLFEPGDTVYVTTEVYNQASTMPSPIEAMPVRLARDPVLMEKTAGEVAGNIPAGGVADNQLKPLSFVIDDPLIPEGYCSKPYVQKATVSARLMNTRLDRPYTESAAQTIEIRYPVELLDRQMHYAIGIDEELSLELEAKNISQKPLGAELGRDVFLQIIAPEYNVIEAKAVRRLEPGQSEKLTARVTMNAQQLYGSQTQYKANLLLQPIDRDKSVSLIQQQIFNVQLTPKYQLSESGFTLVINAETSPAAIQYWMEELTRIAQKPIAVWNTSYYGAFPLETIEKSLLAENPHGTVVVLDNEYTAANGKKVRNSEFVSKDNLLHAAQVHDSSIVIVGENKQLPESYKSDEPVLFWPEPVKHYTSLDSLVQDLLLDKPEDISHAKVTLPAETFFSVSTPEQVLARVRETLEKSFPYRDYHLKVQRAGNSASRVIVEVRRLADKLDAQVKAVNLNASQMLDPQKAASTNQRTLIKALPFSQKLGLFMKSGNPFHQHLTQAIISDLLAEQTLVRQSKTYGSWWDLINGRYRPDYRSELKKLNQLVSCLHTMALQGQLYNAQVWVPMVIQVLAQIQYQVRQQTTFWSRLADFFISQTNEEINRSTRALCKQALASYSQITQAPLNSLESHLDNQSHRLEFEDKLEKYINRLDEALRRRGCFFNTRQCQNERAAAQALLLVCRRQLAPATLENLELLHKGNLKSFFREFTALYPELQEHNEHHPAYV